MDSSSSTDGKHSSVDINMKHRSSMDELCNFEVNRLYGNQETNALTDTQIDEENKALPIEIAHQEATYYDTREVYRMVDEDESLKTPLQVPHECANVSPNQNKSPDGSSASEDVSVSKGYSGSTFSEYDTDECNSRKSLKYASLNTGREIEDSLPENIVLCINTGGPLIRNTSFGIDVSEDCYFDGGNVHCTGENIANTKDSCLYQTARYGNCSYAIQNIPSGSYLVDLHFAEIIFTNGPPGLRMFDVLVQNEKVVSKLDVYSRVGSNTPLVVANVKANVKDKGLIISLRGIVGSPIISGICVRRSATQVLVEHGAELNLDMQVLGQDISESPMQNTNSNKGEECSQLHVQSSDSKIKKRRRTQRHIKEYELKIQALKNEVHEAWMSVQDANRQNEKLQNELDCRSFHVDSLAQAVERQLIDLKEVQDKAESEKQRWLTALLDINSKYELLKQDYTILAKESHEWVNLFPAVQDMSQKVRELVDEHEELKKSFVKQGQDLRIYYNQVLELKGNIRVFCRCRPLSPGEVNAGATAVVEFDPARDNDLVIRTNGSRKQFRFDRVFTPSNNQSDVFVDTAPVVVSVLDGYNVCIFAYGQTGTGKTFTMEGTENDRGVNYRTLEELFHLASQRKGQYEYTISVSVVEVYNEQIRDLLASPLPLGHSAKKLEIKQVADGVHHVPGLTEAMVQSMDEVWDVLQTGSSARVVSSTNCNEHSSRSHCMLCVMVKGESLITGETTRSKLWLVDLAGSERVAKSDVQGERLKEAQSINKSLSALGDVIHALSTKSNHVPYRNSKLTHLLQDSLGGESKTLMFVQISPCELDAGETLCSLNFASRVRGVELGPARKQADSTDTVKYKQMVEKFKQEGKMKDESLRKQEDSMKKLEETLKMKDQASWSLADKVKDQEGVIMNERKARKEQQILIEKLREELRNKVSIMPVIDPSVERKILHPVPLGLNLIKNRVLEDNVKAVDGLESSSMDKALTNKNNEMGSDTDSASMERMKTTISLPKYNLPSSSSSALPRKPGRVSLCVMPRRRPSISMANALPPVTSYSIVQSSRESVQDTFADENQVPNLETCIVSSPKPTGWKKGATIAPSSVLRRSIPRKVHFRLPQFQPGYRKAQPDKDGFRPPTVKTENEGERKVLNKMRRVSVAPIWGKPLPNFQQTVINHQQWNSNNTASAIPLTLPGGARRVLVGNNKASSNMYNKEKIWSR